MEGRQVIEKRHHKVMGAGDVRLSVQDWGSIDAPAIILIHGWSQCHLAFERQADLARDFRLILPDLRGHGASDKPMLEDAYDRSEPWANDMAAIIDHLGLVDAVMIGWSMGGWIVMDYLEHFGHEKLAGVGLVGSAVTNGKYLPPAAAKIRSDNAAKAVGMYREDLAENLTSTRAFLDVCFHQAPDAEDLVKMMGYNMLVPPIVRAAARLRQEDRRDVAKATPIPAWIAWGKHERLAPDEMGEQALAHFPKGQKTVFEQSGHSPFWEEAETFNAALIDFVQSCLHQKEDAA